MSKEPSFVSRCLSGTALPDEIDDYVELWHNNEAGVGLPLHVFLGMDEHEYALWIREPNAIYGVIRAHKNHGRIDDYMDDFYSMPLAARAQSAEDATKITTWLKGMGKIK